MKQPWTKRVVSWVNDGILYQSIPFTWLLDKAEEAARKFPGRVIAGGPAVDLLGAPWAETGADAPSGVLQRHNPNATRTSIGCPRRCSFCINADRPFTQYDFWPRRPVVIDDNLTACTRPHFKRVVDGMVGFSDCDFNQGLDARLFTTWHAGQLARLRRVKVRFSFDSPGMEGPCFDAIKRARSAGLKDFGVYVLIGFDDTPETARYRLERVRSWGVWPNPMRYQPLDTRKKNSFVAAGWTELELKKMTRYYSCLAWLDNVPYENYVHPSERHPATSP